MQQKLVQRGHRSAAWQRQFLVESPSGRWLGTKVKWTSSDNSTVLPIIPLKRHGLRSEHSPGSFSETGKKLAAVPMASCPQFAAAPSPQHAPCGAGQTYLRGVSRGRGGGAQVPPQSLLKVRLSLMRSCCKWVHCAHDISVYTVNIKRPVTATAAPAIFTLNDCTAET